jgi:hypothetical protein
MPATYDSLATTTLGSNQSSVTFSSISGAYTDLVLIAVAKFSANPSYSGIIFNSDSGSNYSSTFMRSTGSAASSGANTNAGQISSGSYSSEYLLDEFNILDYSNTTTYKTVFYKTNQNNDMITRIGMWRNTNAITSVTYQIDTGNILAGSTFTLYGIKAA